MAEKLEEKLRELREGAAEKIPQDAREIMHEATEQLARSGQAERAVGEGGRAPDFELPDSEGRTHSLEDLRSGGPVILAFFRGHW